MVIWERLDLDLEIVTGHDVICIISDSLIRSRGGLGVMRAKNIVLCSIVVESWRTHRY